MSQNCKTLHISNANEPKLHLLSNENTTLLNTNKAKLCPPLQTLHFPNANKPKLHPLMKTLHSLNTNKPKLHPLLKTLHFLNRNKPKLHPPLQILHFSNANGQKLRPLSKPLHFPSPISYGTALLNHTMMVNQVKLQPFIRTMNVQPTLQKSQIPYRLTTDYTTY
jgi:hypothetical protein